MKHCIICTESVMRIAASFAILFQIFLVSWSVPASEKRHATAAYEVVKELPHHIELRKYKPTTWITNELEAQVMDDVSRAGYWKNHRYIRGSNADSESRELVLTICH
ncbi:hypothetical protein Ciccas_004243 [Cichlidogyrus casuarinus]|uniref:Uncharacterized protein n=1 Tax=Cichlidogyrus casuarinus TaxID=1844966 RepID=A0ABD2QC17_9PLAT